MQDADIKAANAREVRKQYHPALCNAMELELYYDKDLLEFSQSVVLNTLPREIDFLVIRRTKPGQVRSELGRIFRKCNIWEFKGYREELSVQVYHKTMSYAYEYFRQMPVEEQLKRRIVMELSYRINGDQRGGNGMGGFFEAYVDPLQEVIKQKDAELEQKDVELEKKVVEMEQNKINNIKLLMKNLKCSLEEALNALEIKGKERTIIVNKLQK